MPGNEPGTGARITGRRAKRKRAVPVWDGPFLFVMGARYRAICSGRVTAPLAEERRM